MEFDKVERSITEDGDRWKVLIPGKQLINQFAAQTRFDAARLKRLYLQEAVRRKAPAFEEIVGIFREFDGM